MNNKAILGLLAATVLTLTGTSEAHADVYSKEACWLAEGFESDAVYQQTLSQWKATQPPHPGYYDLYQSWNTYRFEMDTRVPNLPTITRSDKSLHCYIGCRISQDVNEPSGVYTGWLKEKRDLTDCDSGTHFEIIDSTVTTWGAAWGRNSDDPGICVENCEKLAALNIPH